MKPKTVTKIIALVLVPVAALATPAATYKCIGPLTSYALDAECKLGLDSLGCGVYTCVMNTFDRPVTLCVRGELWDSCDSTRIHYGSPPLLPVNVTIYNENCSWQGAWYLGSCSCPAPSQGQQPVGTYPVEYGC
jgi:hypothetical protein